jgi:hypothetical protein
MTFKQLAKSAGVITSFGAAVLAGTLISRSTVKANVDDFGDLRVQQGFRIAPVPLKLAGKNRRLVGLGSYLVNAVADCNGCHTSQDPTTGAPLEFLPNGNPFFGLPKKINPEAYLSGGNDFGQIEGPNSPHIVSRNLTPDKTGRPEGGQSLGNFLQIMRHGTDFDHAHPNCSSVVTTNCFTPPFDGDLLQIMPWSAFQDMTQTDLIAIYEYLSAIPCIEGPADPNNILHNDCQ